MPDLESYDCLILGAGLSGLAAARHLSAAGWRVAILEKSGGVGGRVATRRLADQSFDHGAPFFSIRSNAFRSVVEELFDNGFCVDWFDDGERTLYRGVPSMNAMAKALAAGLEIENRARVFALQPDEEGVTACCEDGRRFSGKHVLVTAPAPQALDLLEASSIVLEDEVMQRIRSVRYERCIALLALLKSASGMKAPGFTGSISHPIIASISDVALKGTSSLAGVVIQSNDRFATDHFDESKEWLTAQLGQAVAAQLDAPIIETYLHKWKFARRSAAQGGPAFLISNRLPLSFAGDSYGTPDVEGAYLSGLEVAAALLA